MNYANKLFEKTVTVGEKTPFSLPIQISNQGEEPAFNGKMKFVSNIPLPLPSSYRCHSDIEEFIDQAEYSDDSFEADFLAKVRVKSIPGSVNSAIQSMYIYLMVRHRPCMAKV